VWQLATEVWQSATIESTRTKKGRRSGLTRHLISAPGGTKNFVR